MSDRLGAGCHRLAIKAMDRAEFEAVVDNVLAELPEWVDAGCDR